MKEKLVASLVAIGLLAAGVPTPVHAAEKPMRPALEKLDLDGDLVLFLNTATIEERVLNYLDEVSALAQSAMTPSTPEQTRVMNEGMDMVKAAIKWSGLLSMKAYAMSMAPAGGELTRVVAVCEHAEADAAKPLWRLLGSAPRAMKGARYAPANAVYTANSTTSLNEAWKIVNEAVAEFGGPESAATFNQKMMMAEIVIGTNINVITESLDEDLLVSIQFSEDKTVAIPQARGTSLTFPEPSLLIGLGTKNPTLGNIILQKLQLFGMPAVKSTHGAYELHTIALPTPSPVPLSPTLVMTEDYLLIGSSLDVVKDALDSHANQTGLVSTPLYKEMLTAAPAKVSAIEFLSPRFMETYLAALTAAMSANPDPEAAAMLNGMMSGLKNMSAGGYALKTPTGYYSESLANYGGAKPIELLASSYVGIIAAVAIPSFTKARANSQEKACLNNRRIIDAAKEQWAMENAKTAGHEVEESDIAEYITGGLPALVCPACGTYTLNAIGAESACSTHSTGTAP